MNIDEFSTLDRLFSEPFHAARRGITCAIASLDHTLFASPLKNSGVNVAAHRFHRGSASPVVFPLVDRIQGIRLSKL